MILCYLLALPLPFIVTVGAEPSKFALIVKSPDCVLVSAPGVNAILTTQLLPGSRDVLHSCVTENAGLDEDSDTIWTVTPFLLFPSFLIVTSFVLLPCNSTLSKFSVLGETVSFSATGVGVGEGVGVSDAVAVGVPAVAIGVAAVAVGVEVAVAETVAVCVVLAVGEGVVVTVGDGVMDGLGETVAVAVAVAVGAAVPVAEGVEEGEAVALVEVAELLNSII